MGHSGQRGGGGKYGRNSILLVTGASDKSRTWSEKVLSKKPSRSDEWQSSVRAHLRGKEGGRIVCIFRGRERVVRSRRDCFMGGKRLLSGVLGVNQNPTYLKGDKGGKREVETSTNRGNQKGEGEKLQNEGRRSRILGTVTGGALKKPGRPEIQKKGGGVV